MMAIILSYVLLPLHDNFTSLYFRDSLYWNRNLRTLLQGSPRFKGKWSFKVLMGNLPGNECYEHIVGEFSGCLIMHSAEEEAVSMSTQDPTRGDINLQSDLEIPLPDTYQEKWRANARKAPKLIPLWGKTYVCPVCIWEGSYRKQLTSSFLVELDMETWMELGHQCAPDKWILLPEKVGGCGVGHSDMPHQFCPPLNCRNSDWDTWCWQGGLHVSKIISELCLLLGKRWSLSSSPDPNCHSIHSSNTNPNHRLGQTPILNVAKIQNT